MKVKLIRELNKLRLKSKALRLRIRRIPLKKKTNRLIRRMVKLPKETLKTPLPTTRLLQRINQPRRRERRIRSVKRRLQVPSLSTPENR